MAEEIILPLFDDSNVAITGGAASTSLKIRRGSDGYLLDWNDTTFKNAAWTTLATTFTEIDATNVAGYYKKSSVNISGWTDGWYQVIAGYTGSPKRNAVAEWLIKGGKLVEQRTADNLDAAVSLTALETTAQSIKTKTDTILWTDVTRLLGLTLDNAVEDDVVRDGSGNKTSSILYHYSSAANATTHDKATGLIGKYNVTASYTDSKMTLFKVVRVT